MFEYDKYCLKDEQWKDIPGYEGLYQASGFGRIRSVHGKITHSDRHGIRRWSGRILKNKTKIPQSNGYKVSLWKDKKMYDHLVARLVCVTFYGMPENYESKDVKIKMTVNHKDGNRFNNNIENLEWLTIGDNVRHAFENDLIKTSHKVILKNLNTNELFEFKSKSKASIFLGKNSNYLSGQIKRKQKIKDINKNEYECYDAKKYNNNANN